LEAFNDYLGVLESLGCELVDVTIHGMAEARMATFLVLNAEAYQRHARSVGVNWDRYGDVTRVYLLQGAFLTSADFLNALEVGRAVRAHLEQDVLNQHSGGDGVRALAMPTAPFVTAERSRRPGEHSRGINACFTAPFNVTGHPSTSMPAGISDLTGLPIGAMLTGALHDDLGLLQLTYAHERATDWHNAHPDM